MIDNPHGDRAETPLSEAWKRGWLGKHYAMLFDLKARAGASPGPHPLEVVENKDDDRR